MHFYSINPGIDPKQIQQDIIEQPTDKIVIFSEKEWDENTFTPSFAQFLNERNIHVILLVCGCPSSFYEDKFVTRLGFKSIEFVHWETYWLSWSGTTQLMHNKQAFDRTYTSFKYPFICLNNRSHFHRCAMVDELAHYNLVDQGIVTWHQFLPEYHLTYDFKYFDNKVRILSDDFVTKLDSFLIPEEYYQSFLHVITEATCTVIMLTEKIALPILHKKPWVVLAAPGFHKKMVELGFELFDEIIDYSFDEEPDVHKRAEAIARNTANIVNQSNDALMDMYATIKPKIQRNFDNLMRIIKSPDYIPQIVIDRMKMCSSPNIKPLSGDPYYKILGKQAGIDFNTYIITIWGGPGMHSGRDKLVVEEIRALAATEITSICILGQYEFQYDCLFEKDSLYEIIRIANQFNIPIHLLTAAHSSAADQIDFSSEFYKLVKVHYWPLFWLTRTYVLLNQYSHRPESFYKYNLAMKLDINDMQSATTLTNFEHLFITMNKQPKIHRCVLMDMLAKHNLTQHGLLGWRPPKDAAHNYIFKYWTETPCLLDQESGFHCQEVVPLQYTSSFMQLVAESSPTSFILSEKTAIPLFWNKLFLVAGCKGYHKILQSMGFLLYDELFDYSFDDEESTEVRYDKMLDNVDRYVGKTREELATIYLSVKDKLIANKKHAIRAATNIDDFPKIWHDLVEKQTLQNNFVGFEYLLNTELLELKKTYGY